MTSIRVLVASGRMRVRTCASACVCLGGRVGVRVSERVSE